MFTPLFAPISVRRVGDTQQAILFFKQKAFQMNSITAENLQSDSDCRFFLKALRCFDKFTADNALFSALLRLRTTSTLNQKNLIVCKFLKRRNQAEQQFFSTIYIVANAAFFSLYSFFTT